jgi:hypothetical protein
MSGERRATVETVDSDYLRRLERQGGELRTIRQDLPEMLRERTKR